MCGTVRVRTGAEGNHVLRIRLALRPGTPTQATFLRGKSAKRYFDTLNPILNAYIDVVFVTAGTVDELSKTGPFFPCSTG